MDNRIVDLHVHSTESDGTFTPTEVIAEAKNAGLSAIALTDHDTATGRKLDQQVMELRHIQSRSS